MASSLPKGSPHAAASLSSPPSRHDTPEAFAHFIFGACVAARIVHALPLSSNDAIPSTVATLSETTFVLQFHERSTFMVTPVLLARTPSSIVTVPISPPCVSKRPKYKTNTLCPNQSTVVKVKKHPLQGGKRWCPLYLIAPGTPSAMTVTADKSLTKK